MDEDAADGPGRPDIQWDDLTPAVERVGSDAAPAGSADSPSSDAETAPSTPDDSDDSIDADEADADEPSSDKTRSDEPNSNEPVTDDSDPGAPPSDDTDPDELAEAVIQADEASWHPDDESATDETAATDQSATGSEDEWSDLDPAVERVAPTPAVERVAPVPAVTRIEDEDDGMATEDDFTTPETNIGQPDTIGEEPTDQPVAKGPPDDAEQPLAVHIEEMVKRLGIVIGIAGAVSLALFPLTGEVINFLWYSILPGTDVAAPHVYHPLEYKLTQLKVASLGGLIIALPVFVYQTYRFMRPGLYPHERRYYLASVPTSLILGLLGVTFAYFVVLPAIMSYFLYYSQEVVDIAFALGATFDLILLLMGYLAVVFQIPLFVMLAIMMGLTTREWLEGRRLIFWGAFLGVAFLFSPDPTGMAPVLVAATMVVLFEGTLLLLRWTGR